jgi:hypothetical protein
MTAGELAALERCEGVLRAEDRLRDGPLPASADGVYELALRALGDEDAAQDLTYQVLKARSKRGERVE